jgi:hypothetical protein
VDLFSALVPIEVVTPLDHYGDIIGELNRVGGAIEGFELSDPARISARIPAAALKVLELWVAKMFDERVSIELRPIGEVARAAGESSSWLQRLQALGQSQGYLTSAQINDSLPLAIVDPEKIEAIVEQLKRSGIPIRFPPFNQGNSE